MLGQASSPMLAKAEQGIQAKVPQKLQADLERAVHAGLMILYSPKLKADLQKKLAATTDPVTDAARGAAHMLSNLFQQSGKRIPPAVMVPAAGILAFEYLDLLAKAGKVQITPDIIDKTAIAVSDALLPAMGITPEKMQQALAQAKQGGGPAGAVPPHGIIAGQRGA